MNETTTVPSTAVARAPAQQPGSWPERAGGSAGTGPGYRWWALAVIGLAQLMVVLDGRVTVHTRRR